MAYRKPTDKELIESYDRLRLYAGQVGRAMKATAGGDKYNYIGGMNPVDDMRDALEEVEGLLIVGAPTEPGTTIDHRDAWNVAHHRRDNSNLARAYIAMREAAALARTALDGLMGDTDLPDDDSDEMKAMQALSAVLVDLE